MYLASDSNIGKVRDENQDRVLIGSIDDNVSLAVVCDGMGGALSGGVASELAVATIFKRISENFNPAFNANSIRNLMLTSVHAANTLVYEKSKEDIDKNGMGTTCVAAIIVDKTCYIVNVGDSRAYLISDEKIEQITTDHTYVQMLYEQGQITKEELKNHKKKNVITRAVGVEADVDVDYFEIDLPEKFAVLLCSDGLSNYCSEEILYEFIHDKDVNDAISNLINYSNDSGGKDNITAAVIGKEE